MKPKSLYQALNHKSGSKVLGIPRCGFYRAVLSKWDAILPDNHFLLLSLEIERNRNGCYILGRYLLKSIPVATLEIMNFLSFILS